jgi:uncharacterized protein
MNTKLPKASVWYTEVRDLHSTIMGLDYEISTWFPPGYPQPNLKYPVMYVTDPEIHMGFLSSMILGFIVEKCMPAILIVGVGRKGISTLEEWDRARGIDMTPPEDPADVPQKNKRGADFLGLFKKELIPLVESTYPVDPGDRCLTGFSKGGCFTLYALLNEPDLFQRYFVGSGIWERLLPMFLDYEEKLAKQRTSLPIRAFFSVGSLESNFLPFCLQFTDALSRRNYSDLCLDTLTIEGETHLSSKPVALSVGLRALYKPLNPESV